MAVYFFGRALDGAVKIGFTDRDPLVRMGEVARYEQYGDGEL